MRPEGGKTHRVDHLYWLFPMKLQENIPLAPLTTLGVGGPARYFVEASSEAEVREALGFALDRELPLFVLGAGSNVVVADAGLPGLTLKISLRGLESHNRGQFRWYRVAAGEDWDGFVARAVAEGCAGTECLSGIPGTVGGTPVQNVGAYGQEVGETIAEVKTINRYTLQLRSFNPIECAFAYRSSWFNSAGPQRHVILGVEFLLRRNGTPTLRYADLRKAFGSTASPSLKQVREAVLQIRRSKSMVVDPEDANSRTAGSFFKNPVLTQNEYEELGERVRARGFAMPSYPAGPGWRKLSAAWLVEHAGFAKGYARGAVGISTRHALAIVNRGGATAAEVIALKHEIQTRVRAEFGIQLQPEPVLLGF
jgi:UDP-N-acetylmuramate dehydrogenase